MKLSTDRILTTHVGSLPRPDDLFELMLARMDGKPVDETAYAERVRKAVDGQRASSRSRPASTSSATARWASRASSPTRRSGSAAWRSARARGPSPFSNTRETSDFPEYYQSAVAEQVSARRRRALHGLRRADHLQRPRAAQSAISTTLKAALNGVNATEAFVPAIAPSNIETTTPNEYYQTDEEYVFAIAEAMREEYKAIVDAGFLLQIDDPRLVTYYITAARRSASPSAANGRSCASRRSTTRCAAFPPEKVRFHTCYSINMGPRIHDMQLKDIIDIILKVNAGAYSFEAANPRHEHEWEVWERAKLPDDKVLIPGVITQSTVLVEHPELVAQRIVRFAERGRPRARDRRRRLRLRLVRRIERGAPLDRLGEVRGAGRRCPDREQAALAEIAGSLAPQLRKPGASWPVRATYSV